MRPFKLSKCDHILDTQNTRSFDLEEKETLETAFMQGWDDAG